MESASFETASRDEALEYVRRVYDTHHGIVRTPAPFLFRHGRTDHGPWSSDTLYVEGMGISAVPYGTVSICRLRSGRVRLTTGRDALSLQQGDVFVMADPTRPFTAACAAADATFLRLPVAALESVAERSAGVPGGARFAFLSRRPATARAGRRLTDVVRFAERHLVDAIPPGGPVRTAIGDLLAATVLTTFPNTVVAESADVPIRRDVSATVSLALDFVARNADLPITARDVAVHASVSRRALEMAFRDHLGTSPAAYLRRYRLARIHEELVAAEPGDGTSVTGTALRWGFTQSSRFAACYRDVYGEPPSRTLRHVP